MLKTTRAANGEVVDKMSGRLDEENIGDLETLGSEEANRYHVVLDLKDLTPVDQDAVSFLKRCEATTSRSRIAKHIFAMDHESTNQS
jgi:hypothetical protein